MLVTVLKSQSLNLKNHSISQILRECKISVKLLINKLKPKINHLIMELHSKDFVIHWNEIVDQYNEIHRNQDQGDKQQSSSIDDKIKEVQQCYKSIKPETKDNIKEKKEDFTITFNKKSETMPNYMEGKFKVNLDEDEQFGHIEEERVNEIQRKFLKQYNKDHQLYDLEDKTNEAS